jgi:hypothetical protein
MMSDLSGGQASGNLFFALAILGIGMIWRKEYFSSQTAEVKQK